MKLRTEIGNLSPLSAQAFRLDHRHGVLLLGSCFSDNIGSRLKADLFNVFANPFGALYNPLSIRNAARIIAESEGIESTDLFRHDGLWHSPLFHSSFSADSQETALNLMNRSIKQGRTLLPEASAVFITLGSTHIFTDRLSGEVVSNCHKLPADRFIESETGTEETVEALTETIGLLRTINKELHAVLTISPIRHTAYGLEANSLAKARLRVAVDTVCGKLHSVSYFPAYEIMLDDLRDYRFYDADLKHPSPLAIDYIYEKLAERFFSPATASLAAECRKLTRRMAHRRLNPASPQTQEFEIGTEALKRRLLCDHPFLKKALDNMLLKS